MATIINNYSISGGDTTSTTFTGSGGCVKVEATTANINGNSTTLKIQSSDDQATWKDIGQINILIGSDYYCSDPQTVTGLYVRCLLVCNDSNAGTITVTASEEAAGVGDLLSTNNLSDVTSRATANENLGNTHFTYVPTFTAQGNPANIGTCIGDAFVIVVDEDSISFTMQVQFAMDTLETSDEFIFNLPVLPTNNFTGTDQITFIVGLPNAQQLAQLSTVAYASVVGAKTASISVAFTAPNDSLKFTMFVRYHR